MSLLLKQLNSGGVRKMQFRQCTDSSTRIRTFSQFLSCECNQNIVKELSQCVLTVLGRSRYSPAGKNRNVSRKILSASWETQTIVDLYVELLFWLSKANETQWKRDKRDDATDRKNSCVKWLSFSRQPFINYAQIDSIDFRGFRRNDLRFANTKALKTKRNTKSQRKSNDHDVNKNNQEKSICLIRMHN